MPPEPTRTLAILVVDDNVDAAEVLALALEELGFVVEMANDGPSALEVARRLSVDLVFLDIGLPVMDGYEVARLLRAEARFAATRIVALTGYDDVEDRERSLASGFDAHVVKPLDLNELPALMARLRA